MSVWEIPENVETLKRRWADGATAAQIANEIGGVTRHGVIGKVHRLGIQDRHHGNTQGQRDYSTQPRGTRPPRPLPARSETRRVERQRLPSGKLPPLEFDRVADAAAAIAIPAEQRKTLLQLTEKVCHWPVGDPLSPDFFFCGGIAEPDKPYCSEHCGIAYDSAGAQRRAALRGGRPRVNIGF